MDFRGDHFQFAMEYKGLSEVKETPESPNRAKLALFTLAVALAVSLGIPFALEYLDHTLSNLEQVESTFQLRGLGIVPKLPDDRTAASVLIDREKSSENNLIENFRVIRTNLISMGALSKPPQVMMVTSSMPKEGKTIVSSNLAISFSQTGAKTLLMDTDLRRGRLHRLFGYRKSPGLSDVLLGNATLAEACRPTIYDNLTILSAGAHLDTGTELLGSKRFEDIMAEMRRTYDRIVVDTPPVLGLSDTSVMQPHVDGVLFVIWSGKTPIRNMKAAMEMLYTNGANFYGFVLNRLDLSSTTNYYQYYYYSHDYYYHTTHALENA
jgi:capsular exopolysaccharide synthesis family protein